MLNLIKLKQFKQKHTLIFRLKNNLATIKDQEESLKNPYTAFLFACLNIPGTDIKACQEAACKHPICAKWFTAVPGADKQYCLQFSFYV